MQVLRMQSNADGLQLSTAVSSPRRAARLRFFALVIVLELLLLFSTFPARAERVKDLASVAGVRSNPLVGYGLVVAVTFGLTPVLLARYIGQSGDLAAPGYAFVIAAVALIASSLMLGRRASRTFGKAVAT